MSNQPIEGEGRLALRTATALHERWVWLLTAMGTAGLVYVAYLVTHPYPAYAGGLYLVIAEEISRHGYGLPTSIPGYTSGGIPFAYPPLMFYVSAAILDLTGVEPLTLARYLPGIFVIAYLLPYYGIAEELLGDPREAGLATVLFGLTPTVLRWHLSAGGLVRAPALLLALSGIYVGIKLFKTHDRRWLLAATAIFGLLVLTHPTYTVFLVLSYLLLYAAFDRSVNGLIYGTVVGFGGLALAAPWWGQVVATHGVGIFSTAAGTHGGLGRGFYQLAIQLTYALDNFDVEWPFYAAAYLGGAYALRKRQLFLPAWLVASSYILGKNRFLFVAGSMLTAAFVLRAILPRLQRSGFGVERARSASTAAVVLVILGAVLAGVLYGSGIAVAAHENSHAQPSGLDDSDREAMRWIERNTAPSAQFSALGDAAEWLPLLADRSILLGPWGVEWVSTADYYHQIGYYDRISACDRASCVTAALAREGLDPDYVYIPQGQYTVRGKEHVQSPGMRASIKESSHYDVVFENEGVIIARVVGEIVPDRSDHSGYASRAIGSTMVGGSDAHS